MMSSLTSIVCAEVIEELNEQSVYPKHVYLMDMSECFIGFCNSLNNNNTIDPSHHLALFKISLETTIFTYVSNGGYIDEHQFDFFKEEIEDHHPNILIDMDSYDFATIHAGVLARSYYNFIVPHVPDERVCVDMVPVGWSELNGKIILHMGHYDDIRKVLLGEDNG